jgi:hypothetical protein
MSVRLILGLWRAVATLPNVISAFKQTGPHSVWGHEHRALDVAAAWKLERERTVDEAKLQYLRINIRG